MLNTDPQQNQPDHLLSSSPSAASPTGEPNLTALSFSHTRTLEGSPETTSPQLISWLNSRACGMTYREILEEVGERSFEVWPGKDFCHEATVALVRRNPAMHEEYRSLCESESWADRIFGRFTGDLESTSYIKSKSDLGAAVAKLIDAGLLAEVPMTFKSLEGGEFVTYKTESRVTLSDLGRAVLYPEKALEPLSPFVSELAERFDRLPRLGDFEEVGPPSVVLAKKVESILQKEACGISYATIFASVAADSVEIEVGERDFNSVVTRFLVLRNAEMKSELDVILQGQSFFGRLLDSWDLNPEVGKYLAGKSALADAVRELMEVSLVEDIRWVATTNTISVHGVAFPYLNCNLRLSEYGRAAYELMQR